MSRASWAILISILFCSAKPSLSQTIRVGPNLLVSRDSMNSKAELVLAASPKNPRNLVGGAIISGFGAPDTCKTYSSFDGGFTWTDGSFPQLSLGAGDPQVVFAADGSVFFGADSFVLEGGRKRAFIKVFRSEDGGTSWKPFKEVAKGLQPDHPQMAVSSIRSLLYMTVLYTKQNGEYVLALYQLHDTGAVDGPLEFARSEKQMNNFRPLVLSNDVVVLPYSKMTTLSPSGDRLTNEILLGSGIPAELAATGSPPKKVAEQIIDVHNPFSVVPGVFFGTGHRGYTDRLYAVWTDFRFGNARILFSYSSDKGSTWTTAHPVDPTVPGNAHQFQPALYVNDQDVLGITWFDTRDVGDAMFNEYFTASLDGGQSFGSPMKVSSRPSSRLPSGSWPLNATIDSPERMNNGRISVGFISPIGRFPDGGDYMGLTADGEGVFHPFWTDARTGGSQVWTARVKVEAPEPHHDALKRAPPAGRALVNQLVQLVIDPASYDPATNVADVPIRLRNVSDQRIYPPLTVEIAGEGGNVSADKPGRQILNSGNGKPWAGAVFDYSDALGDARALGPGEISEAVLWKVRVAKESKTYFDLELNVRGSLQSR